MSSTRRSALGTALIWNCIYKGNRFNFLSDDVLNFNFFDLVRHPLPQSIFSKAKTGKNNIFNEFTRVY